MTAITVRRCDHLDAVPPQWNPGPLSSLPWLVAFENEVRRPVSFLFEENGDPIGMIAGLEVHSKHAMIRSLGVFRWLYFFTGPVLANLATCPRCIQALNAASRHWGYVKIAYHSWDFPCPTPVNPYPVPGFLREEFLLDLRPPVEAIERNVQDRQRRNIRHAMQIGLQLVEDTSRVRCQQLLAFIEATRRRRQQQGYPAYETYYMPFLCDRVLHTLVDTHALRLFHVERDDVPLNSTAIVEKGQRAFALLAGTTEEGYQLKACPFSFYQIGLHLKREGKAYLNLGGVPEDASRSALRRFKRSLGALEYACPTGRTGILQNGLYKVGLDLYTRCRRHFRS